MPENTTMISDARLKRWGQIALE